MICCCIGWNGEPVPSTTSNPPNTVIQGPCGRSGATAASPVTGLKSVPATLVETSSAATTGSAGAGGSHTGAPASWRRYGLALRSQAMVVTPP